MRIDEAGASAGLRVGLELQTEVDDAVEDAWQYFIPGALYNRNDLDGDGREDYLGTYAQDVRDDKNGLLSILARYPRTRRRSPCRAWTDPPLTRRSTTRR